MPSPDKMVDNMRRGGIATSTAEPFAASQTLDNTAWIMDTAISKEKPPLVKPIL